MIEAAGERVPPLFSFIKAIQSTNIYSYESTTPIIAHTFYLWLILLQKINILPFLIDTELV